MMSGGSSGASKLRKASRAASVESGFEPDEVAKVGSRARWQQEQRELTLWSKFNASRLYQVELTFSAAAGLA